MRPLIAVVLASLCACSTGPLSGPKTPAWFAAVPPADAAATYFVGRSSGPSESAARNGAFSDALHQIVSELKVDYSSVSEDLLTKLSEDLRFASRTEAKAQVQGAQVSDSRIEERRSPAGGLYYDARLLVAFPHAERAAWKERILAEGRGRLAAARESLGLYDKASDPLKALPLLQQAFKGISEARAGAELDAALANDTAALEGEAARRASDLFRRLKLEAAPGQAAVQALYDGLPLADLPVRFSVGPSSAPAAVRFARTDASGTARPDREFLLAHRSQPGLQADLNLRTRAQARKTLPMSACLRVAVYAAETGAGGGKTSAFLSRTAAALRERGFFPVELPAAEADDDELRRRASGSGALFLVVGRSAIKACDNPQPGSYLCRAEGAVRGLDLANGSILFEAAIGPEERVLGIGDSVQRAGAGALEKLSLRLSDKLKDELGALR